MAAEQPTKTYRGNCHCGAFVYEAELPEIKGGVTCSCSMCFKKGARILYAAPKNVRFVKGDESVLTGYRFNTKFITHMVWCALGWECRGRKTWKRASAVRVVLGIG